MDNKNPFLVLGLPANATPAEIKATGQRALMRARLLAEEDAESLHAIQAAVDSLRDPVVRFQSGIEWPSLGPKAAELLRSHPGLVDLRASLADDRNELIELLCEGESQSGAAHIRGVFMLMRACAILNHKLHGTNSSINGPIPPTGIASDLLSRGIEEWATAVASPEFWMAQRLRAREIDDPRLNADAVRGFQDGAMGFALARFANIAQEALRRRDATTCRAITEGILRHHTTHPEVGSILTGVYGPLTGRVRSAIADLRKALKASRFKTAAPYEQLLDRYRAEVVPDIELMVAVGDLPGTSEERARDDAADFLRSVAVQAANDADAYSTSKRALSYAEQAASSGAILEKLRADRDAIANLIAGAERAARTKPQRERLEQAFARGDLRGALAAIDALMAVEDADARRELAELRSNVSSSLATEIFNAAATMIKAGRFNEAYERLEEALVYETVPSERRIIESTRDTLRPHVRPRAAGGRVASTPDPGNPVRNPDWPKPHSKAPQSSGCLIPLGLGASLAISGLIAVTRMLPDLTSLLALAWPSVNP